MSRTDGFGWKEGWEWYQPTTLRPRDNSTSQAWVWDTGSISHCIPVLMLLHGSAAQTYKQKSVSFMKMKKKKKQRTIFVVYKL